MSLYHLMIFNLAISLSYFTPYCLISDKFAYKLQALAPRESQIKEAAVSEITMTSLDLDIIPVKILSRVHIKAHLADMAFRLEALVAYSNDKEWPAEVIIGNNIIRRFNITQDTTLREVHLKIPQEVAMFCHCPFLGCRCSKPRAEVTEDHEDP